jgi:hypothetical protein
MPAALATPAGQPSGIIASHSGPLPGPGP